MSLSSSMRWLGVPWSGWGRSAERASAAAAAAATARTRPPPPPERKSWFGHWKIAAGAGTVLLLGLLAQTEAAAAGGTSPWNELKYRESRLITNDFALGFPVL